MGGVFLLALFMVITAFAFELLDWQKQILFTNSKIIEIIQVCENNKDRKI